MLIVINNRVNQLINCVLPYSNESFFYDNLTGIN